MFTANKHFTTVKSRKLLTAIAIVVLVFAPFILAVTTHAAGALKYAMVRFDRMAQSQATTGTVCAQPTTVATEGQVKVTFPTGFSVSTNTANWTVDTTTNTASWPSPSSAWIGIGTASAVSGQDVTFPSGDLTVGTTYCFNWINSAAITTPSSTGTPTGFITTQTGASADIDAEQYATAVVGANADRIQVSASVPAAFSFSLSSNTDNLGSLSTGTVAHGSGPVAQVDTNAKNGWMVWAKDAYGGLCAPSISTCTIGTTITSPQLFTSTAGNNTLSAGTQGYNMGVTSTSGGGTGTITVPATFTGGLSRGGGLTTSYQAIASSNGTNIAAQLTLTNNAAISGTTTAATDYGDYIYVVGAGLF